MKHLIFTVTNDLNFDQRMIRICSTLAENGYRITLVGRKKKNSQPTENQPFTQKRLSLFFEKGFAFYAEYNLRLFFFLILKPAHLICSIDLDTLPAGYFSARLSGKKIIYDAHEYFTEVPEVVERPKVKKVWSKIADFFIPKVDGAYTVGEGLRLIFEKEYKVNFDLVRNMPFGKRTKKTANFSKKAETKILFYQGALNDGRGLEEMISAMTELPNCQLRLAGEGDLSKELRQLAIDLKVTDRVHFLGWVLPKDLPKLTDEADIGLNLLQNKGLNYYYSLANKFFDYAQSGIPSINMQFPEYQALTKEFETAILIPDLKKETIVAAVQQLSNNPVVYEKLQSNCQVAAAVWNWETESQKLIKFYEKIFNHGKSTNTASINF